MTKETLAVDASFPVVHPERNFGNMFRIHHLQFHTHNRKKSYERYLQEIFMNKENFYKNMIRYSTTLMASFVFIFFFFAPTHAKAEWPHFAISADGTPISFESYGAGEQTLVFVHGWSCDARYWRAQIPYFSQNHRVIVLDLAGHGHSGLGRTQYTMKSFGEDVKAVTEATGSNSVILVGHSMGGPVIAEAARLMPERVSGLSVSIRLRTSNTR
jgi:hypothetical protein